MSIYSRQLGPQMKRYRNLWFFWYLELDLYIVGAGLMSGWLMSISIICCSQREVALAGSMWCNNVEGILARAFYDIMMRLFLDVIGSRVEKRRKPISPSVDHGLDWNGLELLKAIWCITASRAFRVWTPRSVAENCRILGVYAGKQPTTPWNDKKLQGFHRIPIWMLTFFVSMIPA